MSKKLCTTFSLICILCLLSGCVNNEKDLGKWRSSYNSNVRELSLNTAMTNVATLKNELNVFIRSNDLQTVNLSCFEEIPESTVQFLALRDVIEDKYRQSGLQDFERFIGLTTQFNSFEDIDKGVVYLIVTFSGEDKISELTCTLQGGDLVEISFEN